LILQLCNRSARSTFLLWRGVMLRHMRMAAEQILHHLLEHTHAVTVNDADTRSRGHHGAIEKLVDRFTSFVGALADHVDLLMHRRKLRRGPEADILRQFRSARRRLR